MRIAKLRMTNWERFRGETELTLDAKAYAIVARWHDDAERSNWGGKSSLMRAIRFALTGKSGQAKVDGWISKGEKAGDVTIDFDDGSKIVRSRTGAQSTKVWHYAPDGQVAHQDEAEIAIECATGLNDRDFSASCYFAQKQMAQFVSMRAEDRLEIVTSWFRLRQLQDAAEAERIDSVRVTKEVADVEAKLAAQTELRKSVLAGSNCADLSELAKDLAGSETDLADAEGHLLVAREAFGANEALLSAREAKTRLEGLVVEGKVLAEEVEKGAGAKLAARARQVREAMGESSAELSSLERTVQTRRKVALGQFDGRCPVSEIKCPARAEINASREQNQRLLSEAEAQVEAQEKAVAELRQKATAAEAAAQEHERRSARLAAMRETAERLQDEAAALDENEPIEREKSQALLDTRQSLVAELTTESEILRRAVATVEAATAKIAELEERRVGLRVELDLSRATFAVLGKQGVQRRVAEGELAPIEEGANEMLRECGIDLSVSVRWSREGSGLATTCEACGAAFPTSAKAKTCESCGAARGANVVNRLELDLSDRSGAAEDLAGAAVQLSASRWLRSDRGAAWSVAMLDEPFGALDASNRRAFATHLAAMLRGRYGFEQALVIAHDVAVLDAFPGRIEIVAGPTASTVRVVA